MDRSICLESALNLVLLQISLLTHISAHPTKCRKDQRCLEQASRPHPRSCMKGQSNGMEHLGRCAVPGLSGRCRGRGRCPAPRTYSRWHRNVHRRRTLSAGSRPLLAPATPHSAKKKPQKRNIDFIFLLILNKWLNGSRASRMYDSFENNVRFVVAITRRVVVGTFLKYYTQEINRNAFLKYTCRKLLFLSSEHVIFPLHERLML